VRLRDAAEVAKPLGGASRSGAWWRCRCPVHGSRGATLALRDGARGLIVKCFAGCDPRDILAELRRLQLFDGSGEDRGRAAVRPAEHHDDGEAARRIEIARRIWDVARDARGSPVARYLASRGINLPVPPSLRYAPALRRPYGSYGPAMVARIDSIDGALIGIARTWLARDAAGSWRRHDRAMLGRAAGGAVWLAPAGETLMIGEGLETCHAAMQACSLPAWAALSTSGLTRLILPPAVRTVIILADHDRNGVGGRAARTAATRWLAEGRRVRIALPLEPGTDFADVLQGRAYAELLDAAA
jgi:putative DNA primase/helicase